MKLFRQFYNAYPHIGQTPSAKLQQISKKVSDQFTDQELIPADKLITNLSFSHFVELMKIGDQLKRKFYEIEAIKGDWSVRGLKRQINSLSFERSDVAKNPQLLTTTLGKNSERLTPEQIIKTPYVFDFLGLPDGILGSESALETALIDDLKSFILELGHGFCFEAQQKRIVIGGEYFFIDLVFYQRILKCHVIIELKVDEFTHTNAGQLNTYIQYYKENEQQHNDNPPIGILLCTHQNKELVHYALGGMDENLFVSQYKTVLPSTEELEKFLQDEKKKI